MSDLTQKLVDELCSLLDETTILSIANDYDLQKPEEFAAVRDILLAISKDVEAEEATGFAPSGFNEGELASISSLHDEAPGGQRLGDGDLRSSDGLTTTSEGSNAQSLFSSSSITSGEDSPELAFGSILSHLSRQEQVRQLSAMFVSLPEISIKLALERAKGDASLAIDELLNQQLLESTGERPKGVDGFFTSDENVPKKKTRRRRKGKGASKTANSSSSDPVTSPDVVIRQEAAAADKENVTFICTCFSQPEPEATIIYQRHMFSLGAAILEILENYIALGLPSPSGAFEKAFEQEQANRASWVPKHLFTPILATTSSTQSAVAVVDVLAAYFPKPAYLKYDISYSIAASSDVELLSDTTLASGSAAGKSAWKTFTSKPTTTTSTTDGLARQFHGAPTNLEAATTAKEAIAASAKRSYASASAAFRKGKGDPLMRSAGAYYADRARAETASLRQAMSIEAELLVDSQSEGNTIDLHGVTVQDGVDIALRCAWRWWNSLGEVKLRMPGGGGGGGNNSVGLRIVTGLGRHNPGGRSPLRTQVFKALVADGWMVEVLTGAFLLKGRRT